NKIEFIKNAQQLQEAGIALHATRGTADFLKEHGIAVQLLHWPLEGQQPNVLDYLAERKLDLVINIPKNYQEEELTNDDIIRRKAVDFNIPLITDLQLARRFTEALVHKRLEELQIKSWDEYLAVRPAVPIRGAESNGQAEKTTAAAQQEENGRPA